jgi:hypothetical protein
MINNRGMARARAGAMVLACGTAALVVLTGCSSGSSSSSAAGGSTASAAPSPSPSSSAPAWAAALGPGVTVVAPGTAAPGNDSPGAVITGWVDSLTSKKKVTGMCAYVPPGSQSKCRTTFGSVNMSQITAQMPTVKNFGVGYVAIDGTKALVGETGKVCDSATHGCYSNSDPAAIFSSGKPFSSLWKTAAAEANSSSNSNAYSLSPCVEIVGKWYADISL